MSNCPWINTIQCNCNAIGIWARNVIWCNPTHFAKQMLGSMSAKSVECEKFLRCRIELKITLWNNKMYVSSHCTTRAVALPHNHIGRCSYTVSHPLTMTSSLVYNQISCHSTQFNSHVSVKSNKEISSKKSVCMFERILNSQVKAAQFSRLWWVLCKIFVESTSVELQSPIIIFFASSNIQISNKIINNWDWSIHKTLKTWQNQSEQKPKMWSILMRKIALETRDHPHKQFWRTYP